MSTSLSTSRFSRWLGLASFQVMFSAGTPSAAATYLAVSTSNPL